MAEEIQTEALPQEEKAELTRDEVSVLLYFETCLVDRRGHFSTRQMNDEDFAIAKRLRAEGVIDYGRIPYKELRARKVGSPLTSSTHWVEFTDAAWKTVHRERRIRAERHTDTI